MNSNRLRPLSGSRPLPQALPMVASAESERVRGQTRNPRNKPEIRVIEDGQSSRSPAPRDDRVRARAILRETPAVAPIHTTSKTDPGKR